jgi:phosphate-selective porin OprO/OprP
MASIKSSTLCALAAVSALGNWNSIAADAGSVEERLKKLETQVDGLQKENTELKKELGYDPKKPAAFIRGAGKESKMTLGGFLHLQAEFGDSPDARFNGIEDRFLLRRARVNVQGSFLENFDYKAEIDFGANSLSEQTGSRGAVTDFFLNWNKYEYANLKAGQYKTHFGWEQILSDTKLLTIERSLPNDRLTDGRQIGTSVTGAILEKRVSYAIGMFNGTSVNNSFNDNDHFMYTARIQGNALKTEWNKKPVEWNVGANVLTSKDSGVSKSGFGFDLVAGGAVDNLFTGDRNAWGLDTQLKVGPFDVQAEYLRNRFEPDNSTPANGFEADGFYVLGGYYILPNSLQAVIKFEGFDPDKGEAGNSTEVWTFGLNYYIKGDDLKLMANYLYGDQDGVGEGKGRLLLRAQVIF